MKESSENMCNEINKIRNRKSAGKEKENIVPIKKDK